MRKILVIDDNPGDRKLIEEAIEESGLEIDFLEAQDAEDGIKLAKKEELDLILMDIMMPGVSGGEAVKLLKEDRRTEHIPVVFLTGVFSKQEEESQGKINIGEMYYDSIAKPFDIIRLMAIINKHTA